MFDFHGDVIDPPSDLDMGVGVTRPVRAAAGNIDVRATLDALVDEPPGQWMANIATLLASLGERDVTPDERVDLLVLFERCEAWVAAQKQRVLARLSRDADDEPKRTKRTGRWEDTALEIALALRWSEWMVNDRMDVARELDERLPATWQALAQGQINYQKAREIAVGTQKLGDDAKAAVLEQRVLAKADDQTQAEMRRAVDRQVMALDPDGAEQRRQRTRRDRRVTRRPLEDGAGHLGVTGPAEAIAVIHTALTEGACQLKDTGQVDSLDQGRFDTLLDWAVRHLDERLLPNRGTVPVGATLIVKASTAAGLDDDPAEIAGFGPITAQAARDLLAGRPPAPGPFDKWGDRFAPEAYGRDEDLLPTYLRKPEEEPPPDADELPPDDWQWQPPPQPPPPPDASTRAGPSLDPWSVAWRVLKVDPATGWAKPPPGVRMNYGNERRFASPAQSRYVRDRDRTCGFPTCAQSGKQVDIDHRNEAACGGPTDVCNLGPGCPHHNRTTRNRSDWKIEPHGDGTATLITPQGRRYPIQPHDYLS